MLSVYIQNNRAKLLNVHIEERKVNRKNGISNRLHTEKPSPTLQLLLKMDTREEQWHGLTYTQ